ncbi:MAG: histidine phosphatase family protein [Desulfobacteraceae bacterium]|jgi:broad specificity phosphatase PhoE
MTERPTTIYLIRHGEVHNPQRILYGRLPRFRLSETGRQQARMAGRYLDGRVDALFSSPLLRARQTAREIQQHVHKSRIRISTLINEVCTVFEGRPGAEVDARNGDVYTGAPACFEQPQDIVDRTRRFIRRAHRQYPGGRIAAVTHGDVITFMVLWANGMDPSAKNKTRLLKAGFPAAYPAHASITALTYSNDDMDARPQVAYVHP